MGAGVEATRPTRRDSKAVPEGRAYKKYAGPKDKEFMASARSFRSGCIAALDMGFAMAQEV